MREIQIFTDGGCSGNPGPGGWAYIFLVDGREISAFGGASDTTNNRMELIAVISALRAVLSEVSLRHRSISVSTDSQYVKNGITRWIGVWLRNGWRTSAKQPVKNQDLWRELYTLTEGLKLEWHWVRGHAGHGYNEKCDALVRQAIDRRL